MNIETRVVCIQMFLVGIVNFMHLCLNKLFNIHIGGGMKIERFGERDINNWWGFHHISNQHMCGLIY